MRRYVQPNEPSVFVYQSAKLAYVKLKGLLNRLTGSMSLDKVAKRSHGPTRVGGGAIVSESDINVAYHSKTSSSTYVFLCFHEGVES